MNTANGQTKATAANASLSLSLSPVSVLVILSRINPRLGEIIHGNANE